MRELARPFVAAWDWIDRTGGFPGQVVAIALVIMLVIGTLTWVGNRK